MLSINTNLSSQIVQSSLKQSTNSLNTAIERMTTGAKINHAKDNAANYSIATSLSSKISSLQVAEKNVSMGLDMLNTSSEALSQMSSSLSKIRALAVQAQNATYGSKSISALNSEAKALMREISRINETAEYNGIKLFNTGSKEVSNSAKELGLNKQGFLQEVTKIDTSGMTKLSEVDSSTTLAVGEYSISSADDLVKLKNMCNAGLLEKGSTFVLTQDINMSGVTNWEGIGKTNSFGGEFNGNGYTISNLSGTQGLFQTIQRKSDTERWSQVENVKLENVNITSTGGKVGAICGNGENLEIINCSVTGEIKSASGQYIGGIVGYGYYVMSSYCYADVDVSGNKYVGGITGALNYSSAKYCISRGNVSGTTQVGGISGGWNSVTNCASSSNVSGKTIVGGITGSSNANCSDNYFSGSVIGEQYVGGLIGRAFNFPLTNTNNIIKGTVFGTNDVGVFIGYSEKESSITNSYYDQKEVGNLSLAGTNCTVDAQDITIPMEYYLQVGTNADSTTSGITLTTFMDFSALTDILSMGIDDESILEKIDNLVNQVSLKQTEIGTAQNRLFSVLDEISIKYENLVSTHSTICDSDIGEVSSKYIRQQILQQASATLMATANQSPSIALQLL